jgi:hypothetical protein
VIRSYSSDRLNPLDEPLDPEDKKPEKEIKPEAGLNRFVWDLRYEEAARVPGYYLFEYGNGGRGPFALPGKYQVRLTVDGKSQTAPLELQLDPRVQVSQADLEKQFNLHLEVRDTLSRLYNAVNQIEDLRAQLAGLKKRLPENASTRPVLAAAGDLDQKMVGLRDEMIQFKIKANEDSLAYPQKLDSRLAFLALVVSDDTDSAPTQAALDQFAKVKKQADDFQAQWEAMQRTEVAAFQEMATEQNIHAIVVAPVSGVAEGAGGKPR